MSFPKDFLWGAASAAAQIEGGYLDDWQYKQIIETNGEGL